jgi:hypothetical protein
LLGREAERKAHFASLYFRVESFRNNSDSFAIFAAIRRACLMKKKARFAEPSLLGVVRK